MGGGASSARVIPSSGGTDPSHITSPSNVKFDPTLIDKTDKSNITVYMDSTGGSPKSNTTNTSKPPNSDNSNTKLAIPQSSQQAQSALSKFRKKKNIIQINSPDVSPRLSNNEGKFILQSMTNHKNVCQDNDSSTCHDNSSNINHGLYLCCDSNGELSGSEYSTELDSTTVFPFGCEWKVVYLDMKWPQQYFHLFNYGNRRLCRATEEKTEQQTIIPDSGRKPDGIASLSPTSHSPRKSVTSTVSSTQSQPEVPLRQGLLSTIKIEDADKCPSDTKLLF